MSDVELEGIVAISWKKKLYKEGTESTSWNENPESNIYSGMRLGVPITLPKWLYGHSHQCIIYFIWNLLVLFVGVIVRCSNALLCERDLKD